MLVTNSRHNNKLNVALAALGLFCFAYTSCVGTRTSLAPNEVVGHIAKNECAGSQVQQTHMLIALWSKDDTTFIKYPTETSHELNPESPVQIGGLTTSFLVPRLLDEIKRAGLTIDSVAIPVRKQGSGELVRNITYKQLLTHTSSLPVYDITPHLSALDHLIAIDRKLQEQPASEVTGNYRFTHWNYTLAAEALRTKMSGLPRLRVKHLAYNDQLSDSLKHVLAQSQARINAPREHQLPELFALSTAGVATTMQLIGLLDSLDATDLSNPILVPTLPDRPRTKATLGWHVLELKNGNQVFMNSGQTRRHGAAVAYYPATGTGVTVIALDSKRLDCLAVDILRNMNQDWKREPRAK